MEWLNNIIITDIIDVVTIYSPKGRKYSVNKRNCFGLSFCRSGSIVYTENKSETISDKGAAIILPYGASYKLRGEETGFFPLVNFSAVGIDSPKEIIKIPLSNEQFYLREYTKLKQSDIFRHGRVEAMHIMYGILSKLSAETVSIPPAIRNAAEYIENNYFNTELTNNFLAELSNVSEVYLRKLFLKYCGMTPKQYIINIRIQKAKQLLGESRSAISEIAEQCGFTNVYHFCRTFKNAVNLTPTEYRCEFNIVHKNKLL